ncbi:MAG: DNA integrity scanning diadenylate cyclase DisA [archaeon]|nr:DNA integrity scanning diadenylate cyclase DisA [archaeon]
MSDEIIKSEEPINSEIVENESLKDNENEIIVPFSEELNPKKPSFLDVLGRLSPGKSLRTALDDILEGETGGLIVMDCPELRNIMEGGFRINCKFTPQKLAELAKMDGAIILSEDLKRILFSNVLLVPDSRIPSNETGTRHKAAERTAKHTGTISIAVSERRKKISLFYEDKRYILENSEHLLRRATETLNILEKQREIFDDILKNLNILEITKLVSAADVCNILQRTEVIIKMMDTMKRYLTELGNQGVIIRMRVRELFKDIESLESSIMKDYLNKHQNTKKLLESISFEGVMDTESLSRMIFETSPDAQLHPKGMRLLSKLNLTEREIRALLGNFENFSNILDANDDELKKVLRGKAESFKKELNNLKEQVLMGKKI